MDDKPTSTNLLKTNSPVKRVKVDPLAPRLPLYSLSWEEFEMLCVRLQEATNPDVSQAFRYGSNAQGQEGIDVLAILKSGEKIGMECKCVRKATPGELTTWVDRLFARANLRELKEFHFAITINVARNKRLLEAWAAASQRLAEHGVATRLWDFSVIEQALSTRPALIDEFFEEGAAERFGSGAVIEGKWIKQYRKQWENLAGGTVLELEDRSIRMVVQLPTKTNPRLSSSIMFCRSDLRGLAVAIPAQEFVRWMQWTAHATSFQDAPFVHAHMHDRKVSLRLPSPIQLYPAEVNHLYWLLQKAWSHYVTAVSAIDCQWKALRFPIEHGLECPRFSLCKVSEPFWNDIVAYTQEFDISRGRSNQHIFRADPKAIWVDPSEPRGDLAAGDHMLLHAQRDPGASNLTEADFTIFWQPSSWQKSDSYSPADVWDAQYAHDWMMNYLFPMVQSWKQRYEEQANLRARGVMRWLMNLFEPEPPASRPSVRWQSLLAQVAPARISGAADLRGMADTLRRHFVEMAKDRLRVRLEPELLPGVLQACSCLTPFASAHTTSVTGRLLPSKDPQWTTSPEVEEQGRYEVVINALEALSELARDSQNLSATQCDELVDWLEPLSKRWREDRLTLLYW